MKKTTTAHGQIAMNVAPILATNMHFNLKAVNRPNPESLACLLTQMCQTVITVGEVSKLCKVTERQVYNWMEGRSNMLAKHFLVIAHECARRQELRMVELALPTEFHIAPGGNCQPNGSVDDETTKIVRDLGEFIDALERRDKAAMGKELLELREDVNALEAEGHLI